MTAYWRPVLLFILFTLCGSILSQASASHVQKDQASAGGLRITVTDAQGHLVSGVSCSLLLASEPRKIVATAVTNSGGVAAFTQVPDGEYVLRIESKGFETFTKDRIVINGSEVSEMKVVLVVAAPSATVTIRSPDELTTSVQAGATTAAGTLQRGTLQRL